jgi:hypothetical protein
MDTLEANLDQAKSSAIDRLDPSDDLNFRHFRIRHMLAELLRAGLAPGSEAPDFELQSTEGRQMRLHGYVSLSTRGRARHT